MSDCLATTEEHTLAVFVLVPVVVVCHSVGLVQLIIQQASSPIRQNPHQTTVFQLWIMFIPLNLAWSRRSRVKGLKWDGVSSSVRSSSLLGQGAHRWWMFVHWCSVGSVNCLCRNPGNFTESSSEANSPLIINSTVLSFPAVTIAPSRLKLSPEETCCCCPVGNTSSLRPLAHWCRWQRVDLTLRSQPGGKTQLVDAWAQSRTSPHFPCFLFFFPNILSEVIRGPLFLCVFLIYLHQGAAGIRVLCSTFSIFPANPHHESEAEDEAAEALWLSALRVQTSAVGGACKWKLL